MDLGTLANGATTIPLNSLGTSPNKALVIEIQTRLGILGLLDPPADGAFGPVSRWALASFQDLRGIADEAGVGPRTARALLEGTAAGLFPPAAAADALADRIVRHMADKGYWLARHPACRNIVYVEGMDLGGGLNDDAPNRFNDLRLVLGFVDGRATILGRWEATTEPGERWTTAPMNPEGAARIAFGQYKAWAVGRHPAHSANGHEALVQVRDVIVYRDKNKDYSRIGDDPDEGLFGINQHWGYDYPIEDIRDAGAGCLVGRTKAGHREFMKLVKEDPRHAAASSYVFMSTVLDGSQMPAA